MGVTDAMSEIMIMQALHHWYHLALLEDVCEDMLHSLSGAIETLFHFGLCSQELYDMAERLVQLCESRGGVGIGE